MVYMSWNSSRSKNESPAVAGRRARLAEISLKPIFSSSSVATAGAASERCVRPIASFWSGSAVWPLTSGATIASGLTGEVDVNRPIDGFRGKNDDLTAVKSRCFGRGFFGWPVKRINASRIIEVHLVRNQDKVIAVGNNTGPIQHLKGVCCDGERLMATGRAYGQCRSVKN